MIQNLQQWLPSVDQLSQLAEGDFQQFPFFFFMKNEQGKYIACNDSLAQVLGFSKGVDLLGSTDFDLSWANSAQDFRANDARVMSSEKPLCAIETGQLIAGITTAFSYKLPLRLSSKKISGIICIAIPFNSDDLFSSSDNLIHQYFVDYRINLIAKNHTLTKRQKDCLYFFMKGMTTKEIANCLNLSARTVEHYIEAIKAKLNCNSRSQLIAKILEK